MTTIAIANQKGGCGKTTTAINLAACLGRENQRTLLIDMDPQGHASLGLGRCCDDQAGLYEVFLQDVDMESVIISDITTNVDLIPATISLAAAEHLLADFSDKDKQLSFHLEDLLKNREYDFVIIDCPPQLGLLSFNALRSADSVLVPVEMSCFAVDGIDRLTDTLELIAEKYDLEIPVQVLPTMTDYRTRFTTTILDEIRGRFPDSILDTPIHYTVRIKEAAYRGKSIIDYAPQSPAAADYSRLAKQLVDAMTPTKAIMADAYDRIAKLLMEASQKAGEGQNSRPARRKVVLGFSGLEGSDVKIAGDFNSWIPDHEVETRYRDGIIEKVLLVEPGEYQYRLIIDGKWQKDPSNPQQIINTYGEINSLLKVDDAVADLATA